MLISQAHAHENDVEHTHDAPVDGSAEGMVVEPPSMGEAFLYNAAFILLVVLMFYFIFIRPQQKRMNEHVSMLNALKVGDSVVTGGGLVGKVSKLIDDRQIEIELAENLKVVALRSTLLDRPANDEPEKK